MADHGRNEFVGRTTNVDDFIAGTISGGRQAGLELGQLPHEVEVRRDEWSTVFEVVVGVIEGQSTGVHEVRDADGS